MFKFEWCYSWPPPPWIDPPPNIIPAILFKVTQTVNGIEVPIYEEDPETETRRDIDPILSVTLIVEGDVVLPDEPMTSIDDDFEFHGIGRVLISQIDEEGYADTSGAGDVVRAKDSPFGGTIDIKGQFSDDYQGKYYQVLYTKWSDDDAPPNDEDFTPVLDELWPVAQKVGTNWVTIYKSPIELPGIGGGC